jgi:hypothetical protein
LDLLTRRSPCHNLLKVVQLGSIGNLGKISLPRTSAQIFKNNQEIRRFLSHFLAKFRLSNQRDKNPLPPG